MQIMLSRRMTDDADAAIMREIVGHDLGAPTITLPPGLFVGYSGLGLVVGALGELPIHR